jgi:hypothetical protein
MTLCIGWTDSDAVYLTADSAVTVGPRALRNDYSSFGEKQPASSIGNVEESALKILRHRNTAATFAGDAPPINGIFANYVQSSRFLSPREAFDVAWMSSHTGGRLEALFAYHDLAGPHLVKYGPLNNVGDEATTACIGSLPAENREYIRSFVQNMPPQASITDRVVGTICITQRLAIFFNLMESHGIGGLVAGCSVSKSGLQWAPDTMHVILRGQLTDQLSNDGLNVVVTCERFDTFFVCNNLTGSYSGFTNRFGINTGLGYKEMVEHMLVNKDQLPPISTDLKVDYIVFHDVTTELSTIFNVRAGGDRVLKYSLAQESATRRLNVHFTASGNGFATLNRRSFGEGGDIAFVAY